MIRCRIYTLLVIVSLFAVLFTYNPVYTGCEEGNAQECVINHVNDVDLGEYISDIINVNTKYAYVNNKRIVTSVDVKTGKVVSFKPYKDKKVLIGRESYAVYDPKDGSFITYKGMLEGKIEKDIEWNVPTGLAADDRYDVKYYDPKWWVLNGDNQVLFVDRLSGKTITTESPICYEDNPFTFVSSNIALLTRNKAYTSLLLAERGYFDVYEGDVYYCNLKDELPVWKEFEALKSHDSFKPGYFKEIFINYDGVYVVTMSRMPLVENEVRTSIYKMDKYGHLNYESNEEYSIVPCLIDGIYYMYTKRIVSGAWGREYELSLSVTCDSKILKREVTQVTGKNEYILPICYIDNECVYLHYRWEYENEKMDERKNKVTTVMMTGAKGFERPEKSVLPGRNLGQCRLFGNILIFQDENKNVKDGDNWLSVYEIKGDVVPASTWLIPRIGLIQ